MTQVIETMMDGMQTMRCGTQTMERGRGLPARSGGVDLAGLFCHPQATASQRMLFQAAGIKIQLIRSSMAVISKVKTI